MRNSLEKLNDIRLQIFCVENEYKAMCISSLKEAWFSSISLVSGWQQRLLATKDEGGIKFELSLEEYCFNW